MKESTFGNSATESTGSDGLLAIRSRGRSPRRFKWIYLAPVFVLLALTSWAFASPVGASPDDDYHLASIWCANSARTDLCVKDPADDRSRILIPGIVGASCFVSDENKSAGCQRWMDDPSPSVESSHGNWNGAYPPVYYAFMSMFASTDIQSAVIVIRLVNIAIFVVMVTALAWFLPIELKTPSMVGWAITVVPLGVNLVSSINPGSWAVTGVGVAWIAALGWFRTNGARSWVLAGLTSFGVLMAAGARTDSAIYAILGLGIASFLAFEREREYALKLLLPITLAGVALLFYFGSGYANIAANGLASGVPEGRDRMSVFAFNLISIPGLWTGVFGSWGLGWRMETWPGYWTVEFACLAVFIGICSLGVREMFFKKSAMSISLVLTLFVLPLYVLTVGSSVVSENVQPRYILPLVIVLGGLLLLRKSGQFRAGAWHVVPAIVLLSAANSIAMYSNLRRYLTGLDVEQLSLESGSEWWWPGLPVGPTFVWIFGSLMFAVGLGLLGVSWLRRSRLDASI